jgi:hypothetical protein
MDVAELIGTWELVEATVELADGTIVSAPWNQGYLIYTPDGMMSVILDNRDRKSPSTRDEPDGTPADKTSALDGFSAYAGTYTLEGNVVIHHVEFALRILSE